MKIRVTRKTDKITINEPTRRNIIDILLEK